MKVLVVDDEIELCNLLAFQLEDEGYEAVQAYGIEEALEKFEKESPDVVLSDMRMPGGSGIDLLKRLKARSDFQQCQFFLISGFVSMGEKELLGLGIHAVIKKPMMFQDLLEHLQSLSH